MSRIKIKELRLRNYRAFADARLVLDDVTFLVGRNGAGKSTLMDAFGFVSEAVTDSLTNALERRGSFQGLLSGYLHGPDEGLSIALCFEREGGPSILYGFRIKLDPPRGYFVDREILLGKGISYFERDGEGFRTDIDFLHPVLDPGSLGLPLLAGADETWKAVLEFIRLISMHRFSPDAIRSEPKIGKDRRLSRDGHNAGDILNQLEPVDEKWIETWLNAAVACVNGIYVDTVAGRHVIRFVQEPREDVVDIYDASGMSDGTLRSLGILLALRQSPRPSIVLLEEIEDSLHPLAYGVLLEAVEEASEEFPVVISTHSPEILTHPAARAERIRVLQWNNGESCIYHLGKGVREDMKPPMTVGHLLRANALWTEEEPSMVGGEDAFFKVP